MGFAALNPSYGLVAHDAKRKIGYFDWVSNVVDQSDLLSGKEAVLDELTAMLADCVSGLLRHISLTE